MAQCEAKYKIQVGSWTKLPEGIVQKDTREIMKMMADKVGGRVEPFIPLVGSRWRHIGVERGLAVLVYGSGGEDIGLENEPPLFIPYEDLQGMLNQKELSTVQHVSSLINTKLDCRKPDGSVDVELSKAFQDACFEQGIKWSKFDSGYHHLGKHFLYANDKYISFSNKEFVTDDFFENHKNKQINFTYSRKLEWEATAVEPVDGIVTIGGVEYSAKELKEALELIGKAKK